MSGVWSGTHSWTCEVGDTVRHPVWEALGSECGVWGEVQAGKHQHMGGFKAGKLDEPSQETVIQESQAR